MRSGRPYLKIMLPLPRMRLQQLEKEAKRRGIGVQELFRAVILPSWFDDEAKKDMVPIEIDKLLHLIEKYPLNGRKVVKNGKA